MKDASSRVCVVGSVNIDTTYRVPQIPAPGETILAINKAVAPGGKGGNQAVAAASMGSHVTLLACIGRDVEAGLAIAVLTRRRVDCGFHGFWPPCFARIGHPVSPETATLFHG